MTTSQLTIDNQSALDTLRQKFSGIASDVTLSQRDWRALMESGAMATLSISRYRGHKQLTSEDLGIGKEDMTQVQDIIALGHRLLLPKKVLGEFNSLETRARQVLRSYTLKVPTGYFLPNGAYDACARAMADHKARFESLVDDLLVDLDSHRDTMRAQYRTLGIQVARRLYDAGSISYSERWILETDFEDRCMATFPDIETLRQSFKFDLRLAFVPIPYQTQQTETPSYANATNELLTLRRQVLADQARTQQTEVTEFLVSVQSEVYTLVNDALSNVLSAINDNGTLQGRSSVQLRNLVEKISTLNFFEDGRLETIKDEITTILDRPATRRDGNLDAAILRELQDQTSLQLMRLERIDRGNLDLTQVSPSIQIPERANVNQPTLTTPRPVSTLPTLAVNNRTNKRFF